MGILLIASCSNERKNFLLSFRLRTVSILGWFYRNSLDKSTKYLPSQVGLSDGACDRADHVIAQILDRSYSTDSGGRDLSAMNPP